MNDLAARSSRSSCNHVIDLEQDPHDGIVRLTEISDSGPILAVRLISVFQDHNPKSPDVNVWVKHPRSCCDDI
jgi:hypothetical protein